MKLLAIGDIIGRVGRECTKQHISKLKKEYSFDMIIANGENSAGGLGLTKAVSEELFDMGVDVITLGNHTWAKKDIVNFIDDSNRIIRPANYPSHIAGVGSTVYDTGVYKVGVINLLGRVYMDPIDNPFSIVLKEIDKIKNEANFIIVDFHAEATSEKVAMGWHLDGLVSVVFGTHTHIQTADERIFSNGTGYITDLGMTGPINSVLGVDKDISLKKFTDLISDRFEVASGPTQFNGVIFEIDDKTKKVTNIIRLRRDSDDLCK